jgi:hypothetical protein
LDQINSARPLLAVESLYARPYPERSPIDSASTLGPEVAMGVDVAVEAGGIGVFVRVGATVGGTGVFVRVGATVGGTGVFVRVGATVGGTGVFVRVGATVGGTGVFVGVGATVGGTGVFVGGTLVGAGALDSAVTRKLNIPHSYLTCCGKFQLWVFAAS